MEKVEMPEGLLKADELIVKEREIEELLESQSYIEGAFATLFYQEGEPEKVCFQVTLKGDGLEEHVDEISALIVGELDFCDLENSSIVDIQGTVSMSNRKKFPNSTVAATTGPGVRVNGAKLA